MSHGQRLTLEQWQLLSAEYDVIRGRPEFAKSLIQSQDWRISAFVEAIPNFVLNLEEGTVLWRARLGHRTRDDGTKEAWMNEDMRGNPEYPAARANFSGQPILYCGDSKETALAELRPRPGCVVSGCQAMLRRELRILDLGKRPPSVEGNGSFDWLFWKMSEAMAQPVDPGRAEGYYMTQLLAETCRDRGLSGIRFTSAVRRGGHNVALFDPFLVDLKDSEIEWFEAG